MGLVTLSLLHVVAAISTRDPERSAFGAHTFANRRFNLMILGCVGLTLLVTEIGFLQRIFGTTSLTAEQWGVCLLAVLVAIALVEIVKFILRHVGRGAAVPMWLSRSRPAPDSWRGARIALATAIVDPRGAHEEE